MRSVSPILLAASLIAGCSPHPSEASLEKEFADHRAAFDTLADMAAQDSNYTRIAADFTHPDWRLAENERPGDPPAQRWERYRDAFKQLDLEAGVTIYGHDSIVLARSASGILPSGSSVGFMRAGTFPEGMTLLKASQPLDCDVGSDGWCSVAKHLDDNWYLVFEAN